MDGEPYGKLHGAADARTTRRGLPLAAWLALIAGIAGLLVWGYVRFDPFAARSVAAPGGPVSVAVEAAEAKAVRLVDRLSYVGSTEAAEGASLSPYVAGHIKEILVQEGQNVGQGASILRLDDQVARAQLEAARVRLTLKVSQRDRDRTLRQEGFLPQTSLDASDAEVLEAQSEVTSREFDLHLLTVRAPFAGTLGTSRLTVGEYVTPGQKLMELVDLTRMMVEFRVPQRVLRLVRPEAVVTFTTDAFPDRSFTGKIRFVAPQIDPATRSFLVRAELQVPERELRPGLFGQVEVRTGAPRDGVVVPDAALVRQLTGSFVYRIVQDRASLTRVEVGARQAEGTEIVSGLAAGELVVVGGQFKLRDGDPVTVTPALAVAGSS